VTKADKPERNNAPPCAVECADPTGLDPIHFLCRRKTVHEHNRLALPFVEKIDLDRPVLANRHAGGF